MNGVTRKMARVAVRLAFALSFGVGLSGVLGTPACQPQYSCAGEFTSRACSLLDENACGNIRGCKAVTPHCVNKCDVGQDCGSSDCRRSGGSCTSLCEGTSPDDCSTLTAPLGSGLSIPRCEWTDGGADGGTGTCQSVCDGAKDEGACSEKAVAGCVWIACEGTAKDDCPSYGADQCPRSLGCYRDSSATE